MAQHQTCLAEREQSECRRGRPRRLSDPQRLRKSEREQQQVEAVPASLRILVEDDQRSEQAEGNAEKSR